MDVVDPRLENYLLELLPPADPVRREMEELAEERGFPIVGPLVGRLLSLLVKLVDARRVLELGSGFGYSALWFARALPSDGEVVLTEYDPEDLDRARRFLARAGVDVRARYLAGDALERITRLPGPWDIVFIDVDKSQYPDALEAAVERVRPGGLVIVDNVLWHGRVVTEEAPEASTRAVLELNRRIHERRDLTVAMVPLRDGLAICRVEGRGPGE